MDKEGVFILIIFLSFFILLYAIPLPYWIIARMSGLKISLFQILRMRIKRIPVKKIINALILAKKGEVEVSLDRLIKHHAVGGDVLNVVMGLIAASTAHVNLNLEQAFGEDLKGVNIYERIKEIATTRDSDRIF